MIIATAAAAAGSPSPLWYATRGAGAADLVALTVAVVLGIGASLRWEGDSAPRFVTVSLHRTASLLAVALLVVHVGTTLLDPFAGITVRDVLVPVGAAYRPVWLGIGVATADVLVAVALTSLLRRWIGPRVWRRLHWAAYATWPLAVVHGLGTGSDAQSPWLIGLTAACTVAVAVSIARRLLAGRLATVPFRLACGAAAAGTLALISVWAMRGPLAPGWAVAAGTPTPTLAGGGAPGPVHPAGPFADDLVGTMVKDPAGQPVISFRDTVDTALTITVQPPGPGQTLPILTVRRDARVLCSVPARATAALDTLCGAVRIRVDILDGGGTVVGAVRGRLSSSGALA